MRKLRWRALPLEGVGGLGDEVYTIRYINGGKRIEEIGETRGISIVLFFPMTHRFLTYKTF